MSKMKISDDPVIARQQMARELATNSIVNKALARYIEQILEAVNEDTIQPLRDEIDRLRSMEKAANVPNGWQTMDTAPLDKTHVIIAVPTKDQDDFIVGEAYFDPEHYGDDGDWWWAGTNYGDYHSGPISEVNYHGPSFWQHLPAAPSASIEGETP